MNVIKKSPNGAIISVRVVPGSKAFAIEGEDEWTGDTRIKIKNKAIEGKANQELLRELGKILSADIKIISGKKSRKKTLLAETDFESAKKLIR